MDSGGFVSTAFTNFYDAVAGVLLGWHWVFSHVWSRDSGWSWLAATVALAITVRALLSPLSIFDVKARRLMYRMHPRIAELRREYAHDRKRLGQEQKKLWQENRLNPLLTIPLGLVQGVTFLLMFGMYFPPIQAEDAPPLLSGDEGRSLANATFLGVSGGDAFVDSMGVATKVMAASLLILIVVATFRIRRQLTTTNMPPSNIGTHESHEKFLLFLTPVLWVLAGFFMVLDGLFFFAAWYGWLLAEQSIVIRAESPAPGGQSSGARE